MEKEKKETTPKKRAEKYHTKLAVNATFEQVIQASFLGKPPAKKGEQK
jgi:hypothetical protein